MSVEYILFIRLFVYHTCCCCCNVVLLLYVVTARFSGVFPHLHFLTMMLVNYFHIYLRKKVMASRRIRNKRKNERKRVDYAFKKKERNWTIFRSRDYFV